MSHEHGTPPPGVVMPQFPDLPEVLQRPEEPATLTVPVQHDGPVHTQELPSRLGTAFTIFATTAPQVAVNGSPLRKKATLISTDSAFLILPRRANIGTGTGAPWPANIPFVYTAESELSVATTTGTATISVITEDWAR